MSASLLNLAAVPGAAGQPGAAPGAAQGIAQQGANAAQAQGPLAGFEALLAAFFGDQGLTAQAGATGALDQGPLALLAAGAKITDGKAAKPGDAAKPGADKADGDKTDGDKGGSALAQAAAANAVDAAALALIVPQPAGQTSVQAQAAGEGAAGGSPDAAQAGKPGAQPIAAQLAAAAAAADAKTTKGLAVAAQTTAAQTTPSATADSAQADAGKPSQPGAGKAAAAAAAQLQAPLLSNQPAAVTVQTLPAPSPAVAAEAKAAQPAQPQAKDKGETIKAARVEGAPTGPAPAGSAAGKAAETLQAAAETAGKDAGANERDPDAAAAPDAKPATPDANPPAGGFNTALNAQATNAQALAHAAALVRGAPQTVANLAAQIAKKLDGRSTRFDVQLDPAGLGKVDVRVEIDAAGKMSAAMNFDNQQAANELKSRAGELQRALEQAGFDLSGGLSFDIAGQGGQAQGQQDGGQPTFRGRAFQAVIDGGAEAAPTPQTFYRAAPAAGVDIRI